MTDDGVGKSMVINRQYLKDFSTIFSGMSVEELLEDRVRSNLLIACKRDELCPVVLPAALPSQHTGKETNDLTSYFGPGVLLSIVRRMSMEWESLPKEGKTKKAAYEIINGIMNDYLKDPFHRNLVLKAVKDRFVLMVNPYVKVRFGFGFDYSALDNCSFKALVTGRSGLFANLDVSTLKVVDGILMKQFPEWCTDFENSPFLEKWPNHSGETHASAYRRRSAYRNYLEGIPSSWSDLFSDEIYRHGGKFLRFFNKGLTVKISGESQALETLYAIEEFVNATGRMPVGGKNLKGANTWYHWIKSMQEAKKGVGDTVWYPELEKQCMNSSVLPDNMFEVTNG